MATALPPVDANAEMLKQLKCPVCLNYCSPPIIQCVNGHNLCSKCRSKMKNCPLCQGKISIVRNLFAEQISTIRHPCTNLSKGCKFTLILSDMQRHLSICKFGLVPCRLTKRSPENHLCFTPCDWRGAVADLFLHVEQDHPGFCRRGSWAKFSYKIRKQYLFLLNAYNHLFWSLLKYDFTTLDLRGAVFAVDTVTPPAKFGFHYELLSADDTLAIMKRGNIFNQGESDENYNSTIFQGKRMEEQMLTAEKKLNVKVEIRKVN